MFASTSFAIIFAVFLAATVVIAVCGVAITRVAEKLAKSTGFGEALVGGVLLGMATSLSGTVVSVSAALDARPALAFSNAVGGIAAQTAFLALADLFYRRANIEHAAAELVNIFQAALLALMLSLPVLAYTGPDIAVLGVHPVSLVLILVYAAGVRGAARVKAAPMWHPERTPETREEVGGGAATPNPSLTRDFTRFAVLAVALGGAGWAISQAGGALADRTSLGESAIGALLTAVATSMPELITTFAAVRRGALQLAVGGIIGGNAFDLLFLTASDVAYRQGSLYHAIGPDDVFWIAVGMAMTALLLLGLVFREKRGPGAIGFESVGMIVLYVGAAALALS